MVPPRFYVTMIGTPCRQGGCVISEERLGELAEMLAAYGIDTTPAQRRLLLGHLDLVIEKNRVVNLTRIDDWYSGMVLHILDSLLLVPSCEAAPEGPFLDMGTGAGYPGVPLGIVTGRKGLLVDSVGKKVHAVAEFVDELGLAGQLSCRHIRVEDLAREQRGAFSVVVARAVAQTNVLVEYAAPLMAPHGRLVLAKGNLVDEELSAGLAAADTCGLECVSRETHELPDGMGHREIVVFERVRKPHIRLPRKAGEAKRHPLGV